MQNSSQVVLENPAPATGRSKPALALMVSLFFLFGLLTVFNDVLIPHLRGVFQLSYTQAMLIQMAFFGAYALLGLPSSAFIRRVGYKKALVLGLLVVALGCLLFIPAARLVWYPLFLGALLVMASGITLLQVAANPYISALGNPDTAASRLNLAGGFNSMATTVGPIIGGSLILGQVVTSTESGAAAVVPPYLFIAGVVVLMAMILYRYNLPALRTESDNPTKLLSALRFRHLRFGALGIFFYVGAEVTVGSFLINFIGLETIAGMDEAAAANYVALYWGGTMVGRFLGFGFLHKVNTAKALTVVALLACTLVAVGVITTGTWAMWALLAVGLCNSIMWPCIFPLSIKGLGEDTASGSGILITMVVGGAVIPMVQGLLADQIGLQTSFLVALACYAYILFFSIYGHKPRIRA